MSHALNYGTSLAKRLWLTQRNSGNFHLPQTRNKKTKPQIHPVFSFCSTAPGTKRKTHLLGR